MKKILFCILALYSPVSILIAQNTTNSPTSMFGLGEISTGEGGQYAGLGGAGIALRGSNFLNTANPASLTELTEQRFQIDAGIMGSYQNYTQRGASNHSVTGNLNNLSIGCRIIPRWYGAVFLAPVSSVGYAITLDEEIAGTNGSTVSSLFQGEGGLSKMGVSTAYLFDKGLSVGTNLSYVTGTITQTETQGNATEPVLTNIPFMPILVFSTNGQSTANVSSLPEPYTDTHRTSGKRITSTSAAVQEEKILKAA